MQLPTREQVSPKVSVLVTLGAGDAKPASKVTLSVKAVIQPGWHISALGAPESGAFALPTTLDFEPKGLTPVSDAFVPSVEPQSSRVGDATYLQHSQPEQNSILLAVRCPWRIR